MFSFFKRKKPETWKICAKTAAEILVGEHQQFDHILDECGPNSIFHLISKSMTWHDLTTAFIAASSVDVDPNPSAEFRDAVKQVLKFYAEGVAEFKIKGKIESSGRANPGYYLNLLIENGGFQASLKKITEELFRKTHGQIIPAEFFGVSGLLTAHYNVIKSDLEKLKSDLGL